MKSSGILLVTGFILACALVAPSSVTAQRSERASQAEQFDTENRAINSSVFVSQIGEASTVRVNQLTPDNVARVRQGSEQARATGNGSSNVDAALIALK